MRQHLDRWRLGQAASHGRLSRCATSKLADVPASRVNLMKQRIYLHRANTNEYAYLAWFELKETYDLWGSPRRALDMESKVIKTDGCGLLALSAPDDWQKFSTAMHKHSYHRSGVRHTTAGGSGAATITDSSHTPLNALTDPAVLCGVLTGVPAGYQRYQRDLHRNNSAAVIFGMDDTLWFNTRHYFEFYVTPAGPLLGLLPMLVDVDPQYHQPNPSYASFSEELDRILAVRHIQVPLQERSNTLEYWVVPAAQRRETT
jgi:hypothetical protein